MSISTRWKNWTMTKVLNMRYRIDVLRNYIPIGVLPAESCSITYNSDAEIKRSASITCNLGLMRLTVPELNRMGDRISPIIIDDNGVEHREGIYMMIASPKTYGDAYDSVNLELYDESYILAQSAFDTRHYYPAGTPYTQVFNEILTENGFARQYIDPSASTLQIDREFAVGENILKSLNTLLEEAGFDTLHMDTEGYAKCTRKVDKTVPEFIYKANFNPGMTESFDVYGIPNVFVGVVSTPDHSVMTYTAENHNPNSELSIERRGYKLAKVYTLDSIASQEELEEYVNNLLQDSMMAIEGVTFTSDIQPGHDFENCVQVEHKEVTGLYIEKSWSYSFGTAEVMNHYAEKKVIV